MKYYSKKHIDTNMYKKIRITDKNGEVEVKSILDEKFKNVQLQKTSTSYITDKIKNLSDEEKVKELVEYFLRNNTIYKIKQENNVIIVYGISERQLRLSLSHKYSYLIKLIIQKYKEDRVKKLNEIDVKKVKFNLDSKNTSYFVIEEKNDEDKYEEVLYLNLLKKPNGQIIDFDNEFLDNYMSEFINNNSYIIRMISNYTDSRWGFYDKNIRIYLPEHIYIQYATPVIEHNNFIKEENKNQLRLKLENN